MGESSRNPCRKFVGLRMGDVFAGVHWSGDKFRSSVN